MRWTFIRRQTFYLAAIALLLTGCGKKVKQDPKLDLVPASGTVTLGGKPLAEANVSLIYDGTPPVGFFGSGAVTDAQGRYEAQTMGKKGAVPGTYKVTVSKLVNSSGAAIKPEEGMDLEQLKAAGGVAESVPTKYTHQTTTDLKITVEAGKADGYNLELTGG